MRIVARALAMRRTVMRDVREAPLVVPSRRARVLVANGASFALSHGGGRLMADDAANAPNGTTRTTAGIAGVVSAPKGTPIGSLETGRMGTDVAFIGLGPAA